MQMQIIETRTRHFLKVPVADSPARQTPLLFWALFPRRKARNQVRWLKPCVRHISRHRIQGFEDDAMASSADIDGSQIGQPNSHDSKFTHRQISLLAISELVPAADNPRKHSREQVR